MIKPLISVYLLPLHHVQQVSKGRLFRVVKGQKGECSLHLRQTLATLLPLLSQLRLGKLQRRLRLP